MKFPVTYVDLNRPDDELFVITETDWHHDIDAHYAIGPNTSDGQFFLDSAGAVFSLRYTGSGGTGVPIFNIAPSNDQDMMEKVREYVAERT